MASTAMVTMRSGYRDNNLILKGLFSRSLNDFATFILPAFRANAVRSLWFVTIGALGEGGLTQSVVSAAALRALV